jgi:hypothetical protein
MKIASVSNESRSGKEYFGFLFIILLFSWLNGFGQSVVEEKPPIKDRIFYGGNFALQLGTFSDIEILPVVGFWVRPKIAIAAGPGFRFYSFRSERTNIFSARSYIQLVLLRDIDKLVPIGVHTSIIAQLEDEVLSLDSRYWHNVGYEPKRFWVNSVLAGPGVSQQLGKRSSLNIMFLWTLNDNGYQIYSSPEIRLGLVF